jgi:aryl-alcohol dehydrogenase-like predicted oxidoreductase
MRYQLLGRSGLRVSKICLGTMTFGEDWGWGASKDDSRRQYDAFRDAGGNFVDTANLYTNGTSESFLGEFTQGHREQVVLATKYTNAAPGKDPNAGGNQRKNMVQACEASLKRLKTDYIDLYWLHVWDQVTPVDEVMRAFDDLVRAGKILYAGASDVPSWWLARANTMAELRGWTRFVGLQVEYSLIERTVERELIPAARALGVSVTAWSPLAQGVLTGKYTNADGSPKPAPASQGDQGRGHHEMMADFVGLDARKHRVAKAVLDAAKQTGKSAAQVALAWLLSRGDVIPIVGARKLHQLQDNLAAADVTLDAAVLKSLDDASAIDPGFPGSFYANPMVSTFAYGGTKDQLDAAFGVG